jgi:Kef-type K+ transport system membrane component KefB
MLAMLRVGVDHGAARGSRLFGAFLVGAVSPKNEGFVHALLERFEDVMVVLLLPLFFAFTGLRTEVSLIAGSGGWSSARS